MSGGDTPRSGKTTVQNAHTPTPLPQWVIERLERHMDRLYFNPPPPPRLRARYREQLERLNREAEEGKAG